MSNKDSSPYDLCRSCVHFSYSDEVCILRDKWPNEEDLLDNICYDYDDIFDEEEYDE